MIKPGPECGTGNNGSFRPWVVTALSRFGHRSFRHESFRHGSFRRWFVSASLSELQAYV